MERGVLRWIRKGSWAIADQALFAGANFVLGVLLARWMSEVEYGVFATILVAHKFFASQYEALLTEPMLVFGSGRYKRYFSKYLGSLLQAHLGFVAIGSIPLLAGWVLLNTFGKNELSSALIAMAIAEPLILLGPLMRKACYTKGVPKLATISGGIYVVLLLLGIYAFNNTYGLSYLSAFGLMGGSAFVAGLFLMVMLRPAVPDRNMLKVAAHKHWKYGRWASGSRVLQWIPNNIWYLVLPIWIGIEANATLYALLVFNLAITHTYTALESLLVPTLVRAREQGEAAFLGVARRMLAVFFAAGLLYWAVVSVSGESLISWLYQGKYVEEANLLIILGLVPVISGVSTVLIASLRAIERPDLVFWSVLASSVITLTFGLGLTFFYGLLGAAIGLVMVWVVIALVLIWLVKSRPPMVEVGNLQF